MQSTHVCVHWYRSATHVVNITVLKITLNRPIRLTFNLMLVLKSTTINSIYTLNDLFIWKSMNTCAMSCSVNHGRKNASLHFGTLTKNNCLAELSQIHRVLLMWKVRSSLILAKDYKIFVSDQYQSSFSLSFGRKTSSFLCWYFRLIFSFLLWCSVYFV